MNRYQTRDPSMLMTSRRLWIRLLMYPGHTLPTALSPVLVASALAWRDGTFSFWPVFWAFFGSWLIHVGGVFADNYELLKRHQDIEEHPELLQALAQGTLKLAHLRMATLGCFLLGMGPGIYLYFVAGPWVVAVGVIGIAASLGYASGGIRYARLGLADPIFLLMFGLIAPISIFQLLQCVDTGGCTNPWEILPALSAELLLAGLAVGALVTAVLVVDDIRDRHFDQAKGWQTSAVRFGLKASRCEFLILLAFAYIVPIMLTLEPERGSWICLPLLTLPGAIQLSLKVLRFDSTADLHEVTPSMSKLALAYSALLSLGLV